MELIIDCYGWSLTEAKKLSVRERRHWYKRAKAKRENLKT